MKTALYCLATLGLLCAIVGALGSIVSRSPMVTALTGAESTYIVAEPAPFTNGVNGAIVLTLLPVALIVLALRSKKTAGKIIDNLFTPWWEVDYFRFMGWNKEQVTKYHEYLEDATA